MKEVLLFIPCMVDALLPRVARACEVLLRRLGLNPVYRPEQTCCGLIAINAGYTDEARKTAQHFIEVFSGEQDVVCPSGSCVFTVKHRYPELFRDQPEWAERARQLGGRIYELSQYLVDVLKVEDVGASYSGKIAYHHSCQLGRGLEVHEQPLKLLQAIKGAELLTLERADMCCGFGGEFSLNYPEISEALVKGKAETYLESGADLLVICEPGCLLNIGGYLSRHHPDKKAMHMAELLAGQEGKE